LKLRGKAGRDELASAQVPVDIKKRLKAHNALETGGKGGRVARLRLACSGKNRQKNETSFGYSHEKKRNRKLQRCRDCGRNLSWPRIGASNQQFAKCGRERTYENTGGGGSLLIDLQQKR